MKVRGGRKEVAGLGKTGKGVGVGPQRSEEVKGIVIGLFKQLVF